MPLVKVNENDKEIVIEGVRIESDRAKYLVKIPESAVSDHKCNSCPLCRLNLKRLAYSVSKLVSQTWLTGVCGRMCLSCNNSSTRTAASCFNTRLAYAMDHIEK